MKYELFLMDLDDTLLDFKGSERLSFESSLGSLGVKGDLEGIYQSYQGINTALWKLFEQGKTTKEHLKTERFRKLFELHRIEADPFIAGERFLDALPESVVLLDGAVEICEWLAARGEIGVITNGIKQVQTRRIANSGLGPHIGFVSVSEECGFAKPDVRFFEHSVKSARKFRKASTIMIGDRIDADVKGAHDFGIDACWFNPSRHPRPDSIAKPRYEIAELRELRGICGS